MVLIGMLLVNCKNTSQMGSSPTVTDVNDRQNNILFSLKATECSGECPVFTFNFFADSTFYLKSGRFLIEPGEYTYQPTPEEKDSFLEMIKKPNWRSMASTYNKNKKQLNAPAADLPTNYFIYVTEEEEFKIQNNGVEKDALRELKEGLVSYIKTLDWQQQE
jgi:hypothetical protein